MTYLLGSLYPDGEGGYTSYAQDALSPSPVSVVVRAARRLIRDGRPVDLPEDYNLEVLDNVAWVVGYYRRHVTVSARQARELAQIARTLREHHEEQLTLKERHGVMALLQVVEP